MVVFTLVRKILLKTPFKSLGSRSRTLTSQRHPLLHTSISKMHDTPYNPTSSEMEDKMFSGKPWGQEGYVAQQLQEAGFEKVKTEVKRYKAQIGFAKTFVTTFLHSTSTSS